MFLKEGFYGIFIDVVIDVFSAAINEDIRLIYSIIIVSKIHNRIVTRLMYIITTATTPDALVKMIALRS